MFSETVLAAHNDLERELRARGLPATGPILDQSVRLPKTVIYRLSHEGLRVEASRSATAFKDRLHCDERTL